MWYIKWQYFSFSFGLDMELLYVSMYFVLISSPLCICGLPLQTQWAALLMAPTLYIWDPCFSHSMTPVSWIVKNEHGILEKNKKNGGNFLLVKLFIIPIMKFIIIPPRIIVLFSYVVVFLYLQFWQLTCK